MVSDEFLDECLDLGVVVLDAAGILGGEDHVLDLLHLCGRACETALLEVSLDCLGCPFADVEVGALCKHLLLFLVACGL